MSPADPRLPSDEQLTRILSGLVGGKGISDLRKLWRDVNSYSTSYPKAARWVAAFHSETEKRVMSASAAGLRRYDCKYYTGWSLRTRTIAGTFGRQFFWFPGVCDSFEELVRSLLEPTASVIHGAYYPEEILLAGDTLYPVDWETASIATGEVDLAMLTDRWPDEGAR